MLDAAGVDVILVGDSLGNVVLGYESTLPVSLDEMVHHLRAVRRGVKRALLVVDMPFSSYQACGEDAIRNASLLLKQGADAVKLEGGLEMAETVRRLVEVGIPVMGHVGLTPQKVRLFGGHRMQGKDALSAFKIYRDAAALDRAGAFAIVAEVIPPSLAGLITRGVRVPVIGIGAGPDCDGQILVINDLVGLTESAPSFVKRYAEGLELFRKAVASYCADVRGGEFPGARADALAAGELEELKRMIGSLGGK